MDVVPPGNPSSWARDPFRPQVVGDTVHGRGTCDMKAGLVANLAAIRAIRSAKVPLRRPVPCTSRVPTVAVLKACGERSA